MINWDNPHKSIDISSIYEKVKKTGSKVIIGGVIVGTILSFSGMNVKAYANESPSIEVTSQYNNITFDNNITFQDAKFKESVINYFSSSNVSKIITSDDLNNISSLCLDGVNSLNDLKLCPNLKSMVVKNCHISDSSNLSYLSYLNGLSVYSSDFNMDNLKYLSNLKELSICDSNVNMSCIQGLTKLNMLSLTGDKIVGLNNITNSSIKILSIYNNSCHDYSFLGHLNLNNLSLKSVYVNDFSFLEKLESLNYLDLGLTNFKDVSYLSNLTKLDSISLSTTYIENISLLPKNITWLDISACTKLKDINNIKNLPNLEEFYANGDEQLLTSDLYYYLKNNNIKNTFSEKDLTVNKELDDIIGTIITDGMSDFDKMKAITLYITCHMKYVDKIKNIGMSLSTSLSGEGVCKDYALLMAVLGEKAGLNIYLQEGMVGNTGHVWNAVKIDNNWYEIDATWLDSDDLIASIKNNQITDYYLKTGEEFDESRITTTTPYLTSNTKSFYNDTNDKIINKWSTYGVISGDSNGNFLPNNYLTRAEMAKVLCNLLNLTEKGEIKFRDVSKDSWYYDYISKCVEAGLINGYDNNNFGPNDKLTVGQCQLLIDRVLGRDIPYFNYTNEELGDNKYISRGNMIKLLNDSINYFINKPGTYNINCDTVIIASNDVIIEGNVNHLIKAKGVENVKINMGKALN